MSSGSKAEMQGQNGDRTSGSQLQRRLRSPAWWIADVSSRGSSFLGYERMERSSDVLLREADIASIHLSPQRSRAGEGDSESSQPLLTCLVRPKASLHGAYAQIKAGYLDTVYVHTYTV